MLNLDKLKIKDRLKRKGDVDKPEDKKPEEAEVEEVEGEESEAEKVESEETEGKEAEGEHKGEGEQVNESEQRQADDGSVKSRLMKIASNDLNAFPDKIALDKKFRKHKKGFGKDLISLLLKIAVTIAAFSAVFMFVFGIYRATDPYMVPAIKDGDVVMYYRIDKAYVADDVVVLRYEGETMAGRVIAVGGDVVDIDDKGLKVNGSYHAEQDIYFDTTQVADGVTFPLEVPAGKVFLLGDNRPHAVDSRIYGCVDVNDTLGKVIVLLRRREF